MEAQSWGRVSSARVDRYLKIVDWAKRRYTDANGRLVTHVGLVMAPYARVERTAWDYLMASDLPLVRRGR